MSVRTELARLEGAKRSIKTSIQNKGVDVPDGALLSTYASYIDQIDTDVVWGEIGGTLANQTDLKNALDGKFNTTGGIITGPLWVQSVSSDETKAAVLWTDVDEEAVALYGVSGIKEAGFTVTMNNGTAEMSAQDGSDTNKITLSADDAVLDVMGDNDNSIATKEYVDNHSSSARVEGDTLIL